MKDLVDATRGGTWRCEIVTGDTKVVNRGKVDRVFINTAGVGVMRAERDELELEADFKSETAALNGLVRSIFDVTTQIHCLKDPTRL